MRYTNKQKGFSLIEMAIVLVIVGLVLSALLLPLRAQRDSAALAETNATLEIAKKALLGFAQAQGRLPCPATDSSNGAESPLGGGVCTQQVGFLPAVTLGIQPTNAQGFAIDAWNNRIQYAVTIANANAFVTSNGISNLGITTLAPDLRVCNSATGITATRCSGGTESNYSINNAVVVIYSTGATGPLDSAGKPDENANLNDADSNGIIDDGVFVSHDFRATGATGGEFDHIVTWISPYVLYNAMIEAGQLH